ncbi:TerB family tellurite resistance protein [Taklimakanibacter lacteus]|uniref:tellurite resistance TerB family protein n=1 Tax=Taklimakanibacter lacteus TaxID=2268456 RepID=UPI000E66A2A5
MIDRLIDFLSGRDAPVLADRKDDLAHAVAALLVEAARMDDNFDGAERTTIERLLADRFDLKPQAVKSLVEAAEQAVQRSTQYYSFTRQINDRLSEEEKVRIIEMLWKVAYSDGVLDPHEDMLLRRIAGLIHVTDLDRGLARKRALAKLGLSMN